MMDEQRIESVYEELFGDAIRESTAMRLGDPLTGAVSIPIKEIGMPGWVWVHGISGENLAPTGEAGLSDEDQGGATSALLKPNKIPPGMLVYGAPVLVKLEKGVFIVEDLDGYAAVEFFHDFRERDQRSTDISQLDILLTRPTKPPSLSVEITGGVITLDNVAYNIPTIIVDLSSYVPISTSNPDSIAIRIELDPATATAILTAGDPFDNDTHDNAFDLYYPQDLTPTAYLSSWVRLVLGMTSIQITDILHAQELFNKGGSGGTPLIYCDEPLYYKGEVITYP